MDQFHNEKENIHPKLKRRSSILKENADGEKIFVRADVSAPKRRVSFADTTSIKEFLITRGANTEWNRTYEEPMPNETSSLASLEMELTNTGINKKESIYKRNSTIISTMEVSTPQNLAPPQVQGGDGTEIISSFLSGFLGIEAAGSEIGLNSSMKRETDMEFTSCIKSVVTDSLARDENSAKMDAKLNISLDPAKENMLDSSNLNASDIDLDKSLFPKEYDIDIHEESIESKDKDVEMEVTSCVNRMSILKSLDCNSDAQETKVNFCEMELTKPVHSARDLLQETSTLLNKDDPLKRDVNMFPLSHSEIFDPDMEMTVPVMSKQTLNNLVHNLSAESAEMEMTVGVSSAISISDRNKSLLKKNSIVSCLNISELGTPSKGLCSDIESGSFTMNITGVESKYFDDDVIYSAEPAKILGLMGGVKQDIAYASLASGNITQLNSSNVDGKFNETISSPDKNSPHKNIEECGMGEKPHEVIMVEEPIMQTRESENKQAKEIDMEITQPLHYSEILGDKLEIGNEQAKEIDLEITYPLNNNCSKILGDKLEIGNEQAKEIDMEITYPLNNCSKILQADLHFESKCNDESMQESEQMYTPTNASLDNELHVQCDNKNSGTDQSQNFEKSVEVNSAIMSAQNNSEYIVSAECSTLYNVRNLSTEEIVISEVHSEATETLDESLVNQSKLDDDVFYETEDMKIKKTESYSSSKEEEEISVNTFKACEEASKTFEEIVIMENEGGKEDISDIHVAELEIQKSSSFCMSDEGKMEEITVSTWRTCEEASKTFQEIAITENDKVGLDIQDVQCNTGDEFKNAQYDKGEHICNNKDVGTGDSVVTVAMDGTIEDLGEEHLVNSYPIPGSSRENLSPSELVRNEEIHKMDNVNNDIMRDNIDRTSLDISKFTSNIEKVNKVELEMKMEEVPSMMETGDTNSIIYSEECLNDINIDLVEADTDSEEQESIISSDGIGIGVCRNTNESSLLKGDSCSKDLNESTLVNSGGQISCEVATNILVNERKVRLMEENSVSEIEEKRRKLNDEQSSAEIVHSSPKHFDEIHPSLSKDSTLTMSLSMSSNPHVIQRDDSKSHSSSLIVNSSSTSNTRCRVQSENVKHIDSSKGTPAKAKVSELNTLCKYCHRILQSDSIFRVEKVCDKYHFTLKKTNFILILDLVEKKKHQLIAGADWHPQIKDLKKVPARLSMKLFESCFSHHVDRLVGKNICQAKDLFKTLANTYRPMISLLREINLILQTHWSNCNEDGLHVTVSNAKAHIMVEMKIQITADITDWACQPIILIEPFIKIGNLRKKSVEDVIKAAEGSRLWIWNKIKAVDSLVSNMT